jgi:hypothetical protein
MNTLLARYSPEQLATIQDFIQQATQTLEEETVRIRQQTAAPSPKLRIEHEDGS